MQRDDLRATGRTDGRHHRAVATVLLVLAVLVPSTFAVARPTPSATKGGTAAATGSSTEVASDDLVNWTMSVEDSDPEAVTGILTDTIGDGHSYVPGSVKVPTGWQVFFSNETSGDNFSAPESAAARRVRAITTKGEEPGSLLGAVAPVPGALPTKTGGDGWVPIVGNPRTFNVFHHTGAGKPEVNCTDRRSAGTCPGYPKEVSISATDDFFTPFSAAATIDDQGRLWFSGTHDLPGSNDPGGFYCWDTNTDTKCGNGFYPVTDNLRAGTAYVARSPFSGVATEGTRLYALAIHPTTGPKANRIDLECFDTATLTACGTVSLNSAGLPGWNNDQYAEGRSPVLQMRQIGSRAYFLIDYGANPGPNEGLGNRLLCADLTTGGPCAGWTTPAVPGTTGGATLRFSNLLFPDLTGGSAVCVVNTFVTLTFFSQTATRPVSCFSATGGPGPVPNGVQAAVDAVPNAVATFSGPASFAAAGYVSAEVGTRIFMPFSTPVDAAITGVNSWALCFDFATGARCPDFGAAGVRTFPDVNKGFLSAYGFSTDENGCMWGLGDAGWQISFNSFGNASSCTASSASVLVQPRNDYCAPTPPANLRWDAARLTDVDLNKVLSAKVSAFAPDGTPVTSLQGIEMVDGQLGLGDLPIDNGYTFRLKLLTSDPGAVNAGSKFQVTFIGPPVQMCLQTRPVSVCTPPPTIRNDFEAVLVDDEGPTTNTATATMSVLTPDGCTTTTTTEPPPPPPPPTTAPNTTTPTTPTSTTVPDTTTTAPPPTVSPETTIRTPTTTTPPPNVLPATEERELPNTGSDAVPLALSGVLLLLAGLVLMDLRRRHR
ncbi:MAG: LPXTG cell wall anchor domain-containing protein [Actinomycetes bacterium]